MTDTRQGGTIVKLSYSKSQGVKMCLKTGRVGASLEVLFIPL